VRLPAQTLAGARPPRHPLLDSSSLLHSSERCTIRPSERARQGEFRNVQWTRRGEWAPRDTLTPGGSAVGSGGRSYLLNRLHQIKSREMC